MAVSHTPDGGSATRRKPYSTPCLVSYGHVKDIVQGSVGPMTGDGGNTTKPCWIAETLYGRDDARTVLLRAWLTQGYVRGRRWWPFVALYMKAGQVTARLIDKGRLPRRLFLALFNWLFEKAFQETAGQIRAATR